MALALLTAESGSTERFRAELGTNRFYQYVVGSRRQRRADGVEVVAAPEHTSSLYGPVPPERLGTANFTVDPSLFSRERRFLQLWSFRSPDRAGPAVSDIVTVAAPLAAADVGHDTELPSISFSRSGTMTTQDPATATAPLRYREAPLSNAMFLDALGGVLNGILPHLGGLLGGISGGITAAGGGAGAAPLAEVGRVIANPDVLRQLMQLLTQVNAARSPTPAATPAAPAAVPAAAPAAVPAPAGGAAAAQALSRRRAVPAPALSRRAVEPLPRCQPAYSEAMVAPALLAALPALMPLLQQVLNPQTVQAVLNAPNQHMGTVINGVLDMARIGAEDHQRLREHLERLNPGVDDPALDRLMMSMIQSLDAGPEPLQFTRTSAVRLAFEQAPPIMLGGRECMAYRHGDELAFPLTVDTPRPIRHAVLQLEVKDARTLAVHHHSRHRLEQVTSGRMLTVPTVPAAAAGRLPAHRDYIVCVSLAWKTKQGQTRGTSLQQEITLLGEYTYDRLDEASELIPLADPDRFRDYWHRIHVHEFESGMKRIDFDVRYYLVLAPQRHSHARLETHVRAEVADRRTRGQLRAGIELAPAALNRLLVELEPGAQPLAAAELDALLAPAFAERFNQAARYRAQLRGRDGDRGVLWVYPEFKVQRITLQQAAEVNGHGQVLRTAPHDVRFPMPALLHFLGARSQ
jgi:hypothetical protein